MSHTRSAMQEKKNPLRCDVFFGPEDLLQQDLKVLKDRKKELSQASGIYHSNACVRR